MSWYIYVHYYSLSINSNRLCTQKRKNARWCNQSWSLSIIPRYPPKMIIYCHHSHHWYCCCPHQHPQHCQSCHCPCCRRPVQACSNSTSFVALWCEPSTCLLVASSFVKSSLATFLRPGIMETNGIKFLPARRNSYSSQDVFNNSSLCQLHTLTLQ